MKMKNTVYSIQFPVFIHICMEKRRAHSFLPLFFFPTVRWMDITLSEGRSWQERGKGKTMEIMSLKCIKNHLPWNRTEEPTGYSRAEFWLEVFRYLTLEDYTEFIWTTLHIIYNIYMCVIII